MTEGHEHVGRGHDHAGHDLPGHGHSHGLRGIRNVRILAVSLGLVLATMAAEVVAGAIAGSLALLADAGHMLTDAVALGLALFASWAAAKPPRGRYTFGFKRAEILAAQANGLVLAGLAVWILVEGVRRLIDPPEVRAELMGWVALAGVLVSIAISVLLARAQDESLNIRAAYLHVVLDVVAFAGTGIAAALIVLTGWDRFDPIASMLVAVLLARGSYELLRETTQIFLEGAPVVRSARGGGPLDRRAPRRRRDARPPRLDGDERLPGALGPRPRRASRRLSPHPSRARGDAAGPLRPRAHDAPGGARRRRQRSRDPPQPAPVTLSSHSRARIGTVRHTRVGGLTPWVRPL